MKHASLGSRLLFLGLATASAVMLAPNAGAVLLVYEGFDYTSGPLAGKGGTTDFGFSGNWTTTGTGGALDTGLERLPLVSDGSAVNMSGGGTTINFRQLDRTFDENDGETWVSILAQRTEDTPSGNFAGLSFYNTSGSEAANAEWGLTSTTTLATQQWRVQELNGPNGNSGTPIVNGQTDLLVAQIVWHEQGSQTMNFWLNPSVSGGALGDPTASIATSILNFDKIRVAAANGAPFVFDEIRIGETVHDVTPFIPPNPDLDGGGVGQSDFDLIRNNFLTFASHANGDVDYSGFVDHTDYFLWRQAFLAGGGSLSAIRSLNVPEPSAAVLALGMVGAVGAICRRRSQAARR